MSQTFPAAADLGPAHTGKTIGYRVLNLDRTTYSAFSTTGVSETIAGMGYYVKSGGAVGPDAGGYIVWGTSGNDYAEDTVDPAPPTTAQIDTQLSGTHGAGSWATATGFATQTNVSDAQVAIIAAIPGTAAIVTAIKAAAIMAGVSLEDVLRNLWSQIIGDSDGNDPDDPSTVTYKDAAGNVDVTHALTETTRRVTTA